MFDISVIICSYNPDAAAFARCLSAVRELQHPPGARVEVVLVDNNSSPPLSGREDVRALLQAAPWTRLVHEPQPGLAFARLRGHRETSAPLVVFFDDDNEPEPDYLVVALACSRDYPDVFAWGPGKTTVEFLADLPADLKAQWAPLFQDRRFESVQFGCVPATWQPFYPYGTGLVLRREVLIAFSRGIESGTLRGIGRQGASLASGDDTQLVWEAIKLGKAAGVHPRLSLRHLIGNHRANPGYVARLIFGTGSAYMPVLCESFPEQRELLTRIPRHSNLRIAREVVLTSARCVLAPRRRFVRIELARRLAPIAGLRRASGLRWEGSWIQLLASRLGLL
jgi:hypothetical protein